MNLAIVSSFRVCRGMSVTLLKCCTLVKVSPILELGSDLKHLYIEDVERGAELSFSGPQILFSNDQILVSDSRTDGRTDGQTQ